MQAGIDLRPKRKLFARLEGVDDGVGELEVTGLQHFILPFSLLSIGLALSTVVWTIEFSIKHIGKRGRVAVDDIEIDDIHG